jgi:hypothetical protein
MARTYKLDHFTKGTGASVAPLDDAEAVGGPEPSLNTVRIPAERRAPRVKDPQRTSTALPPGHVRKKATGELGRVKAVDPRAGTVDVLWLHSGRRSTVPLATVSRR